jgi:prepilin-type N-terminal cleavage/methylation domain-containing protein
MAKNTAFTLLELLIVVVIIGVLGTLAINMFGPARENALNSEAEANLKLILGAERILRMESGNYYASTAPHETNINTTLRVYLPVAANRNWLYRTFANNAADPQTCCVQAQRNGVDNRTWRLRNTEDDPIRGVCP